MNDSKTKKIKPKSVGRVLRSRRCIEKNSILKNLPLKIGKNCTITIPKRRNLRYQTKIALSRLHTARCLFEERPTVDHK